MYPAFIAIYSGAGVMKRFKNIEVVNFIVVDNTLRRFQIRDWLCFVLEKRYG